MNHEQLLEQIAEKAYLSGKHYLRSTGIMDEITPWRSVPNWVVDTTIYFVRAAMTEGTANPQFLHEIFLEYMDDEGFSFGPAPSVMRKKHPKMLPFNQLSAREIGEYQKIIDTVREIAVPKILNPEIADEPAEDKREVVQTNGGSGDHKGGTDRVSGEKPPDETDAPDPLDSMNLDELRLEAERMGISFDRRTRETGMKELIRARING
jgi:hypothetical protein